MTGMTRPRVTWARTAERNVWAAPVGSAVLLAAPVGATGLRWGSGAATSGRRAGTTPH